MNRDEGSYQLSHTYLLGELMRAPDPLAAMGATSKGEGKRGKGEEGRGPSSLVAD